MSDWSISSVNFDEGALDHLLNSPAGDVGRHMRGLGRRILIGARAIAGTSSGRLRRSLKMSQERTTRGQIVVVGSDLSYAYLHHEGTKPHIIDPPGSRIMTFNAGGRRIYTQRIHHPGTRGTHYLTIPLRQVVR